MKRCLNSQKPKYYLNASGCMGYDTVKDIYTQYPTEDEYYEHLREENNESNDNR
jgi:hypothetical protein